MIALMAAAEVELEALSEIIAPAELQMTCEIEHKIPKPVPGCIVLGGGNCMTLPISSDKLSR